VLPGEDELVAIEGAHAAIVFGPGAEVLELRIDALPAAIMGAIRRQSMQCMWLDPYGSLTRGHGGVGWEGTEVAIAHLAGDADELPVLDAPRPNTCPDTGQLYGGSEKTIAARSPPRSGARADL
jgi:hypothetical protein